MFGTVWHTVKGRDRAAGPRRQRKTRRGRLDVELLEQRCLLDSGFRSITGLGNNVAHPDWGSANTALLRVAPAAYADGISSPVVGSPARPSPRAVSNKVVDQGTADIISDRLMSAMVYAWGQFLDHDLDLTTTGTEAFDIPVPKGDPYFDPSGTGAQVIHFTRSKSVAGTGTSPGNPRQQPNEITAFIDGSMIYGSSAVVADALRTHIGGRLMTSPGPDKVIGTADDLLPYNNHTYFPGISLDPNDPDAAFAIANDAHLVADHDLFMAGDVRANENIELTSLHTLFVREHNRLADQFTAAGFSDEDSYQLARRWVSAEIESITYNEWIPAVLGSGALTAYTGYKNTVNPGIATEFSTASFRLGHSMLGDDIKFLNNNGVPVRDEIALSEGFFNPPVVAQSGIGPILKYLVSDPASEVDTKIVNSVRNFLFGPPGAGGFDLASLNIQRGRDHGLADYNSIRAAYGLPRVSSFSKITANSDLQGKLKDLYGNVNNIDPWIGGLAEDHLPGTSTGPLIRAVLIDQFTRLRDGDRYWFENVFSGADLTTLRNTRLVDVIKRNSDITNVQSNAFFFKFSISGTVFKDANGNGVQDSGETGLAGRAVQLEDLQGNVLATTTTDGSGRYLFNDFSGIDTGQFNVREIPQSGWGSTTANPVAVAITRGDQFLTVNFGNQKGAASGLSTLASSALVAGPLTTKSSQPSTTTVSGQTSQSASGPTTAATQPAPQHSVVPGATDPAQAGISGGASQDPLPDDPFTF